MLTGTHINYYFICKRKLWFFVHDVQCEQDSDNVRLGRLQHEMSYSREKKEIELDNAGVLDWFDSARGIVHEVKKSDAMEESHEWQILFYLLHLKQKGLQIAEFEGDEGIIGEIDYPALKSKTTIILTPERQKTLENEILQGVENCITSAMPPETIKSKACRSCAYFELCYS